MSVIIRMSVQQSKVRATMTGFRLSYAILHLRRCAERKNILKSLTWCDVAATDQVIMSAVIGMGEVSVIWICVYPAQPINEVSSNTARIKFTYFLAFCHYADTGM